MCAIAGIVSYGDRLLDQEALVRMVRSQVHRGPDAQGQFVKDNVGIGHCRLSIIDLSGGKQPFLNEEGDVALTYNGEIYNFRELRKDLIGKGWVFRTDSDTEVVLRSYQEWGKECVTRFEGMFAFAVADYRKREIFLARDHFGIKPLVYRFDESGFAFASELQALAAAPGWTGEFNLLAIDHYLRLQYIPDPETAFRKVYKLPPGHRLTVRMGEPYLKLERYWEPKFASGFLTSEVSDDELESVLRDSVKRHLVADVPFGAFLSGGVDSSLMVSYMAEALGRKVQTFSIGFDDSSVSELHYARKVAERYHCDHHEEIVEVSAMELLPEIVRHYGEPFGDQSAIPTWCLARLTRGSVPMAISGDGGDELFGGYGTYGGWMKKVLHLTPDEGPNWRRNGLKVARRIWPSRYRTPACPADDSRHWLDFVGRFDKGQRESLWRPEYRFLADAPDSAVDLALTNGGGGAGIRRVQGIDIATFLPADILTKVDIASMAFGLEVRPPILDQRVFKVAARMQAENLYSMDSQGRFEGKLPLKRLLGRQFGQEFAMRTKQGFVVPLRNWLYGNKEVQAETRERLMGTESKLVDWFDRQGIDRAIGDRNPYNTWLLLVLDEWFRQISQRKGLEHGTPIPVVGCSR
jgi:asparagine synthase (glutamine-hydrolysing)